MRVTQTSPDAQQRFCPATFGPVHWLNVGTICEHSSATGSGDVVGLEVDIIEGAFVGIGLGFAVGDGVGLGLWAGVVGAVPGMH